jgi:hypothetical protein
MREKFKYFAGHFAKDKTTLVPFVNTAFKSYDFILTGGPLDNAVTQVAEPFQTRQETVQSIMRKTRTRKMMCL